MIKEFGKFKMSYREGSCDEAVIDENLVRDIFFNGVPEYKCEPTHTIFDIGAHIGAFSVVAADRVRCGRVFAYEPDSESFEYLATNVALNGFSNVRVNRLAISGKGGQVLLYKDLEEGSWGNSICKKSSVYETVGSVTLGLSLGIVGGCDFMKFNCEGAEYEIILNTPKIVFDKIGTMVVLYHTDLVTGYSVKDLIKHLESCDFKVRVRNEKNDRGWLICYR